MWYAAVATIHHFGLDSGSHSKPLTRHHGMYLVGTIYNFCTYHQSLTTPDQRLRTPAMAAGITNQRWTVHDLLRYQVPPSQWYPPKRQGRRSRRLQALIDRWVPNDHR